ncbi:MAG: hypothetical protein JOZ11_16795, partial [Alphaproteobacteria bacterium]|nr:hypothetical protein [Alphaproteobacteria bacterium]
MKRPAALLPIVLALGAIILAPVAGAQAENSREEGPTEIEKCRTIDKPGSYKLVNNLTATAGGDCLNITASFVTIDLAGFSISGPSSNPAGTAITAGTHTTDIAVRNGSISFFSSGVSLGGDGSIVEGLRVSGFGVVTADVAISANGIVKGNTVFAFAGGGPPANGVGISATGVVTGNLVDGARHGGMQ